MVSHLETVLAGWDTKSVQDITDIYHSQCTDQAFIIDLIGFLNKPNCQIAASWLLKHHFEETGNQQQFASDIYQQLTGLIFWQSRLHILQSMQYLPIDENSVTKVELFVRDCLTDMNKFVRAWAYNGFYLLAQQYSNYQHEAEDFLKLGLTDEPASVKVRIRKCLQQGFN